MYARQRKERPRTWDIGCFSESPKSRHEPGVEAHTFSHAENLVRADMCLLRGREISSCENIQVHDRPGEQGCHRPCQRADSGKMQGAPGRFEVPHRSIVSACPIWTGGRQKPGLPRLVGRTSDQGDEKPRLSDIEAPRRLEPRGIESVCL